jgi:hypothetical protein
MFCACGCGNLTTIAQRTRTRKGWVKGQPKKFVRGHNRRRSVEEGFREYCPAGAGDECWIWAGGVSSDGYGTIQRGGLAYAHRLSYEKYIGPIPDGLHIAHLCRVRLCVNPNHLEAVAPGENTRRGLAPIVLRQYRRDKHPRAKLTWADVVSIRLLHKAGWSTRAIAKRYPVSKTVVHDIVSGKLWRPLSEFG